MSFGSVMGAIVSLKNNKRPRSSKTDKYFKTTGAKSTAVKSHTQLTVQELKLLREKIKNENDHQLRITILISALILFIIVAFTYYFLFKNKNFFSF